MGGMRLPPLPLLATLLLAACVSPETGDPAEIAARLPGTWSTSPEVVARHLRPEERPEDEVPVHTLELVRDDSVVELVPGRLSSLEVILAGHARYRRPADAEAHDVLFFYGTHRGRAAFVTLGPNRTGPYGDSDEAFVRLRPGSPDVLVFEIAVRDTPRIAYERRASAPSR